MSSEATTDRYEGADHSAHPASTATEGGADVALLIELPGGEAALMPAVRQGKGVMIMSGESAVIAGSSQPGSQLWRDLKDDGWKWVQDGAFGQKYWRRDSIEKDTIKKKPRRQ